jgi:predicted Zn-dependent peptidase
LKLLATILGETFDCRLNRKLRIEHGLTYGARGYFDFGIDASSFRISTFTRTDRTADAIKLALDEVTRFCSEPVTEEELSAARDTLIGQVPVSLETPAQVAGRWWTLALWDLPPEWHEAYLKAIAAWQSAEALRALADRVLNPDNFSIVVAGEQASLAKSLTPWGQVEVADSIAF